MWKNKTTIMLGIILLLGTFLRFYMLGQNPVSMYWDEPAMGYNAYSILHTGKDEYGTKLPILFRSYNDYKMGPYIYLTVIPVALFGLTEFSVRFWSAFFGSATIVGVYFLTKYLLEISPIFQNKQISKYANKQIPLVVTLLFAISPWSINFSRVGFEANVGLFTVVLGTIFFLKACIQKSGAWYLGSLVTFAITIYFYRSEWVFVPLFLISLHFFLRKFLVFKTHLILGAVMLGILMIPLGLAVHAEKTPDRSAQVNFTKEDVVHLDHQLSVWRMHFQTVGGSVIFNRRFIHVYQLTGNYLSNLSPNYLFFSGDPEDRHGARGMGVLYLIDLPFLLIGLWMVLKNRSILGKILISWILIGIIPAAIAVPNPHALRTLHTVAAYEIVIDIGIVAVYQMLMKRSFWQKSFVVFTILLYIIGFSRFLYLYFVVSPKLTAYHYADGYKQLYQYVSPMTKVTKYKKIVISGYYWKPYIYFLFYSRYDPATYQKNGTERGFGRYYFGETGWDSVDKAHAGLSAVNLHDIANSSDVLLALGPNEYRFQNERNQVIDPLKMIYNSDGQLMFIITRPR